MIISTENKAKHYWDFYTMLLVLYIASVLPYRIGLGLEETTFTKAFGAV
jgi:hypothetical protein